MSTTEHNPAPAEHDPLEPVARLRRDTEKLEGLLDIERGGITRTIELQKLLQTLEHETRLLLGAERFQVRASNPEETEDSVPVDELKQALYEAFKSISSDGLDTPSAHIEYVRKRLRAAVA